MCFKNAIITNTLCKFYRYLEQFDIISVIVKLELTETGFRELTPWRHFGQMSLFHDLQKFDPHFFLLILIVIKDSIE